MNLNLQNTPTSFEVEYEKINSLSSEFAERFENILKHPEFIPYKNRILDLLKMKSLSKDEDTELALWNIFWISLNKIWEMIKQDRIDEAFGKIINYLKLQDIYEHLSKNWIVFNQFASEQNQADDYSKKIAA